MYVRKCEEKGNIVVSACALYTAQMSGMTGTTIPQ